MNDNFAKIFRWYAVVDREGEQMHLQRFAARSMIDSQWHPDVLADGYYCGIRQSDTGALAAARQHAKHARESA